MTVLPNAAVKKLVQGQITPQMIVYVTKKAESVLPCDPAPANAAPGREDEQAIPPLPQFVERLVRGSKVSTGTFLSTLVYLDRLKHKLPKLARGMHCTCHRVFLATLIIASKYLNDSSPRNKHWARFSGVFSLAKVNLMERQLLYLLDYDLRITEDQLACHLGVFLKPRSVDTAGYTVIAMPCAQYAPRQLRRPQSHGYIKPMVTAQAQQQQQLQHLQTQQHVRMQPLQPHTPNRTPSQAGRLPQQPKPLSVPLMSSQTPSTAGPARSMLNPSKQQVVFASSPVYISDPMDEDEADDAGRRPEDSSRLPLVMTKDLLSHYPNSSRDQYGRRLSSTSSCSSASSSSIATPISTQVYQQQQQQQYQHQQRNVQIMPTRHATPNPIISVTQWTLAQKSADGAGVVHHVAQQQQHHQQQQQQQQQQHPPQYNSGQPLSCSAFCTSHRQQILLPPPVPSSSIPRIIYQSH